MTPTNDTESKARAGIYLPEQLWKRLRTVAVERGVSASSLAEEAIVAKLERLDREASRSKQRTA